MSVGSFTPPGPANTFFPSGRAVEKRMPRLLEVVLPMMPPWEEPPMPPNQVLRVPCGGFRRWPYNESAPLLLLGAHQEQVRADRGRSS